MSRIQNMPEYSMTNKEGKITVVVNLNYDDCLQGTEDKLFTDICKSLLDIGSNDFRLFTVKRGRLVDTDISNIATKPTQAAVIVCHAPIDGGGIKFAKCINNWFKNNPDGCGRIYQHDGKWCFDDNC